MKSKFHPFHMITMSPWPIMTSFSIWLSTCILAISFFYKTSHASALTVPMLMAMAFLWWKDMVRESIKQGSHHSNVMEGLKMGMILFISSEVLFFVSFFWAYFHSSVSPSVDIGQNWPPNSIESFNPMNVPLLNTLILLSSGVSVTWSHHSLLNNSKSDASFSLLITSMLGIYFTALQGLEYWQAPFSISDSSYGASFYMATGFHGVHVMIGTAFLSICYLRLLSNQNNMSHLMGFELAAWYWHFVDVVWLFLYTSIYWWGS